MPCGIAKESFPFGPCTSILSVCKAIFTPAGIGIGLFPIRNIFSIFLDWKYRLPNFAKYLAAHLGLARRARPRWAERYFAKFGSRYFQSRKIEKMSRIGHKPIPVSAGVKIALQTDKIDVQGPKGKLSFAIPHGITIEQKDRVLTALRATNAHRSLHGLAPALA